MGKRFVGRVVLVTGASSGIGCELARQLAAEGAAVCLAARRLEKLEGLKKEIEASGGRALAVTCDVTKEGDPEKAVAEAQKQLGRLDVVVANAGFGVVGRIERLTLDDFRRQMETNFFGLIRTILAAIEPLKETKGQIVIMGSVAAFLGQARSSPYSASKAAVTGLAECIRHDLAPHGIAVTLLSPGIIDSDITRVDNEGLLHPERKDPRPAWLMVSAPRAVKDMVRSIARRQAHAVITGHGKVLVFASRLAPWLTRMLAGFGVQGRRSRRKDKRSTAAPEPPAAQGSGGE